VKKISSHEKNNRGGDLDGFAGGIDEEADLSVRAAWLHFGGGLTQSEVAARLGVPPVKAHRLIARAKSMGVVHVTIDGPIGACIALEQRLTNQYGLSFCQVAPDLEDDPLPLRTLGLVGSRFLSRALLSGEHEVIGFGHGRTLAACVTMLPQMSAPGVKLVSLLGGLSRRYATTPFDVIHRLAERTGAEAYVLPLPFYANTIEDRAVLLEQRGVQPIMAMGIGATLRLVGIGTMEADASILSTGMAEEEEFEEARRAGGVGEVLGHIFGAEGQVIESGLSARALSMPVEEIGRQTTIAIAGGKSKIAPLKAALASGLIRGLITDERTAKTLTA